MVQGTSMNTDPGKKTISFGAIAAMLMLLVTLLPVLLFKYFPTVDGPAHLYNATLIRGLVSGDSDWYRQFFYFNQVPVPNWTGHFFQALTGLFLPVWITEKFLLLIVLGMLPYAVFSILKAAGIKMGWQCVMVLPFLFTVLLYLGFFNYLIGVSVMLLMLNRILHWKTPVPLSGFLWLSAGTLILYFSHLLPLILLMGFSVLIFLINRKEIVAPAKVAMQMVGLFVLPIAGTIYSFRFKGIEGYQGKISRIDLTELLSWITSGQPFIGLNGDVEGRTASLFAIMLIVAALVALFYIVRKRMKLAGGFWLASAIDLLVLYLVVPDGIGGGGFISLRLLLLFFLFLVIWLLHLELPSLLRTALIVTSLFAAWYPSLYRIDSAKQLSADASAVIDAAEKLPPHSVLLPLNYSTHWLHINLSAYAGTRSGVVVLDNYEAKLVDFPLRWKPSAAPALSAGNFAQSNNPEIDVDGYEKKSGIKINVVSRWSYSNQVADTIATKTDTDIKRDFQLYDKSGNFEVFMRDGSYFSE